MLLWVIFEPQESIYLEKEIFTTLKYLFIQISTFKY